MKKIIFIFSLLLFLVACSSKNEEYLKVSVTNNGSLLCGIKENICITTDNVTINCIGCKENIIQYCELGFTRGNEVKCWCKRINIVEGITNCLNG